MIRKPPKPKPCAFSKCRKEPDPYADHVNETTRFGFIFNGVHFERVCVGKDGAITVYVSSKRDKRFIRVTKGGRISMHKP